MQVTPWAMHPRTVALAMSGSLVVLALALSFIELPEASLLGALLRAEPTHLVAHTLIYGGLAALLASWWFPPRALLGDRISLRRRCIGAALCFVATASAQELVQALTRHHLPSREEAFDLAVDLAAAALGLIVWAGRDGQRAVRVAKALGVVLHPAAVAPIGVFAVTWAALRDTREALTWAVAATLTGIPVVVVWGMGLRRGWFGDSQLSVRTERGPFLLAALLSIAGLACFARAVDAPSSVQALCLAGLLATLGTAAATALGLKVSGHVAVPVGVLGLLSAHSARGLWPFALTALALSWARVREGRHTPQEVLGAWGLASASALWVRG